MLLSALFTSPIIFFAILIAIVYAIAIHEFCHVLVAYLQGDETGKSMGRLTLNPLAHLDLVGFVMVLVAGFGWGKPAPYNPYNLKNQKWGPAIVAVAGPLSNILSAIIFGFIFAALSHRQIFAPDNMLMFFLQYLSIINLTLFTFNLIPIPPLDGSKILFAALPARLDQFKISFERLGPMILIGLILLDSFSPISVFGALFNFVTGIFYRFFF